MDVREKLVEQAISYFWYGVSHDIFSEPVTTYAKLAIEALKKENGVTVQECGQWIYDFNLAGSNFYRCSVCDRQETLLEKEDIYEYCPFCHCGAKMMPQPPKGE